MDVKGKTVLVVDDDQDLRESLRELLIALGAWVIEAETGLKAMKVLETVKNVDLILTDIIMPDSDGIALIRHTHKNFPGIRMIALSGGGAGSAQDYLYNALLLGADRVIIKPAQSSEIQKVIASL